MQIFLRSLTGKVIPLTVESSDTVASLKAAIEKREGVPAPVQKLVLSGKELADNLTLEAAGVKNEAIVSLILKKKEETADPMLQRLIDSFMAGARNKDVDVVFCFDTTGSMYGHLNEVRKKLHESVERLHRDIKGIRIGVLAIGDYCDACNPNSYAVKAFDLSTDLKGIVGFVNGVAQTSGGDTPEAYELALREALSLKWREEAGNKALVIIGDAPPHPPSYTTEKIWWRDELAKLAKRGIKVYGVQCGSDGAAKDFFDEMASGTGGVYMDLARVSLITDMFLAVCYKEFGNEAFEKFKSEATAAKPADAGLAQMFTDEHRSCCSCEALGTQAP